MRTVAGNAPRPVPDDRNSSDTGKDARHRPERPAPQSRRTQHNNEPKGSNTFVAMRRERI